MLKILIVEDDSQLATTLKYLVEDNPRYRVVGMADEADSAVAAAELHQPDLALVDLHLARGTTGSPPTRSAGTIWQSDHGARKARALIGGPRSPEAVTS